MLSHASKFTGLGLAVFVGGVFVVPACGSDGNGGGASTGGTGGSSTGGTSAGGTGTGGTGTGGTGTGGTATGGGGTATGGGGTGGAGTGGNSVAGMNAGGFGGTPQTAAACKGIVPKEALISDFNNLASPTWGTGTSDTDFSGGFFTYPPAPITFSTAADNFTASGNVATYSGFGLYVTYCGDASSYAGVRFTISGDAGQSGSMVFFVQTNATKWADGQKGTCLGPKTIEFSECVPPNTTITGITAQPKEVTILWTDVSGGKPAAAATTDGSDIIGFNFAFTWPEAAAYAASITIDDMELVGEGAGTGGAGGAGSGGAGGAP